MYPPSIPQKVEKLVLNTGFVLKAEYAKRPEKTSKLPYLTGLFIWSERQDLNLRPLPPQGSTLAKLSYAPTFIGFCHG